MHTLKVWFSSFFALLFPRCCVVCNRPLSMAEEVLCTTCNIRMPRTHYHLKEDNAIEKLFWGQIPIVRGTAFFHYQKGSNYCHIIHQLKYKGEKEIGEIMGRYIANELQHSGFFDGIDVIMPIPIHKKRRKERGYNQSEWIAQGVAHITHIPVDVHSFTRHIYTSSQTKQSLFDRWENVKDAFGLQHPERFAGKHVLIVDDVLTTGSTITACAQTLSQVEGVRISVIALGVAR